MRTSWPAARFDSGKMLRAASIMPRACQLSAPARTRILRRVSLSPTLTTSVSRPSRSASVSSASCARLGEHGGVRRHGLGVRSRPRRSSSGRAVGVGFGAGADLLGFGLGLLGADDVLGDLGIVERLPVLDRQDAAQKLDDVDGDVALIGRARLALLAVARGVVGVELQRIEARNVRLVVGRNRREPPHDAHVGLGVDVLATAAPLLQDR